MGLDWIPANLILFFLLILIGYAIFDRWIYFIRSSYSLQK